jgi:hypothetical protein
MKTAMISYNTFVQGEENGWKHGPNAAVLLLQNTTGATWGTSQSGKSHDEWYAETVAIVDPLWEQLKSELPTLDCVIMYVGSHGAERIIELAALYGLTPDRALFVLCHCNSGYKMMAISTNGFEASPIIGCECGGHETMKRLYEEALES